LRAILLGAQSNKTFRELKLTTLEIKGFKSFADKTLIDFQEGVTAIVGPNGCGKSNIVDAIRWVLGEQSTRSLRSEKMENVIFNGTSKRKPSNLAEVSLSFDNTRKILATDYSHITLTRKLYRSGESEYRLNDVPCRLKDITDLFLDTGIGSDSYSIIELRMVEELISNKEGSRRTLFEEAAGIAKYRVRKKQTHSKLKDTQDDLERVEDLLFEIGKNLKSLEQQAKRTEKYYRLKDQYKEIMILISIQRILGKREDWALAEKKENQVLDEILSFKTQMEVEESDLEKKKLDQLTSENQVSFQQKAVNTFVAEIQRKENEQRFKNEKIKNLSDRKDKLIVELEQDKNQIQVLESNLEKTRDRLSPETEKISGMEERLLHFQTKMGELGILQKDQKSSLEVHQQHIRKQKESAYQLEKELDKLEVQKESLQGENQRNAKEQESIQLEIAQSESRLENIGTKFTMDQESLEFKRKKELELTEAIQKDEKIVESLREELSKQTRLLDSSQNEYNLTKSLVDSLEGFPESIVFLKKKADWLKSIPLLSDIIFCPEEYRIPIEIYLEPFMNFFVVEKREEAERAIELLSDSSKGRSQFFILDDFQHFPQPLPEEPYVDLDPDWVLVEEVIEVEPKYRNLIKALLGNVLLGNRVKTFLNSPLSKDWVFLEKRGIFFASHHRLSGGSIGLFEGKRIGRAKNLEVLQKNMDGIKKTIYELNQNREQILTDLQLHKKEMETLRVREAMNELTRTESERNNLVNLKENLGNKFRLLGLRTQDLINQKEKLEEREKSILPELEALKESIRILERDLELKMKESEEIQTQYQFHSQSFNQLNLEYHQLKNLIASLEKDISFNKTQLEGIKSREIRLQNELVQVENELLEQRKLETAQDEDFISLYEEKTKMEAGMVELEEVYNGLRNQILEKERLINDFRRKKEGADSRLQELKENRNRLGFELKSIGERICMEFSLTEDAWDELLNAEESNIRWELEILEEREEQARKLRNQIENYGAINPLAMEAFLEIQERYNFIQNQKEDLIQAKASLMETIAEIDLTAREKFMTAFTSVRESFIKVFRTLFNEEDSCDLLLVNPNEPLDSDIEIIARPKGKRPLTINQLSGGEKTLTATAILFSLYLLRPAPFCIFDEVDAPLDDTNIDKFNSIIREFSGNSQFIVVSHNKKTISSTDIIYGVTMAESGISKVVAVDLRKAENAA